MAEKTFDSAGVTTREIDLTGPRKVEPVGIPAGVVGTSAKGPAFVPVTLGTVDDFLQRFGEPNKKHFGVYAVKEWLRNAQAVTYLRVLGIGDGNKRLTGNNEGSVKNSGFVVGQQLPNTNAGAIAGNPYANANGSLGRCYFLGCYMSESKDSTYFSDAGIQTSISGTVVLRGVVFAASGVVPRLSSSYGKGAKPLSDLIATSATATGSITGSIVLSKDGTSKQEFVLLLNGLKGTTEDPNVITASFDPDANNYIAKAFNTDSKKLEKTGHLLYTYWDVHTAQAVPTGSGIILNVSGANAGGNVHVGVEEIAFLTTGTLTRDSGSTVVSNYENWEDRFSTAKTPFFVSQKNGGTRYDLFKLHSIDDGANVSDKIKISVENLKPSDDVANKYGTFDVVVRDFDDLDTNKKVLEAFRGLSLDPSSDLYVAKTIGDQNVFFDFEKKSQAQKLV
ncbi:MAG: hypothetical protein AABY15_08005, partial [Nanoarchaeota archaeon]